jgi:hypothetical protein
MHTGVVGTVAHALLSTEEQRAHWPARPVPAGWHAPRAAFGHESGPGFVAEKSFSHALHCDEAVSQTGVAPAQSALVKHPTQMFAGLHSGVGAEQSALVRQATHSFAVVSHLGAAGLVQSESTAQITHDPAFMPVVTHADPPGLPSQSAFVWHGTQVCVVVSHVGVIPAQSELNSQSTQVPVGKSHTSEAPLHAVPFVWEHWPHAPQTSHAGVVGVLVQSASDPQATQAPPVQIGVSPPQFAALTHCTQVLAVVHLGDPAGQFASATQSTHSPLFTPLVAHSGVGVLQSALLEHALQVSVIASQIGFAPEQFASVKQPTHELVGTSQTGVAPVHAVPLVAEQTAQTPTASQAGVAPLHAESPSQPQGTPLVLTSSWYTSCSLSCGLAPVAEAKPTNVCGPSRVNRLLPA